MDYIIAVDIGGTHLRAALYRTDALEPLKHYRMKTYANGQRPQENMIQAIQTIWPAEGRVRGIGIASPGPLNPHAGIILTTPNIPELRNFRLSEFIGQHFHCPVWLDNDANLAALGEWRYGAGQGHHHLLYLTISTGIGGGVIIADQLLQGAQGMAAELGHVVVLPDGPQCTCGRRGHLEAISSGTAIVRYVQEQLASGVSSSLREVTPLTADEVARAAQDGDALACQAFQRAGEYLGLALASFLHIFNPSIVVFGGGVSQSGDLLFRPMHRRLQENVFPSYLENLTFAMAALGDDAGLFGARALVESHLSGPGAAPAL